MAKIMRSISDRSKEVRGESLSTQPLLTDGYTYGNINEVRENISSKIPDEESLESLEETIQENLNMKRKKTSEKKSPRRGIR